MTAMMINGLRVKSIIMELEDGSLIYKEAPLIHQSPEPIVIEAPEEPALIEAELEEPTIEEPVNDPPSNKKRGWRRSKKEGTYIKIPIKDCEGIAAYTAKTGREMIVVIHKSGTKANGTKWYKLLFLSKCEGFGEHPTGGFWGIPSRLSDFKWFN
jgi:hypothetical protein